MGNHNDGRLVEVVGWSGPHEKGGEVGKISEVVVGVGGSELSAQIGQLLSDRAAVGRLPESRCRNCKRDLRLYKGRWYHIEMGGGQYYEAHGCSRPYPLRCVKCGARIDYRTVEPMYYDFECQNCIEKSKEGDKIGVLIDDLRKQLQSGSHRYLKYGTMCSVVLTKNGIWFVDIC